jgi:catechol 2,3-dioxygenase-like lactoylglutathione lyase family enzyme
MRFHQPRLYSVAAGGGGPGIGRVDHRASAAEASHAASEAIVWSMVAFHHVNLGVPVDGLEAEADFLLDVLGYRRVEVDEQLEQMGVNWFEADDGSQVHLSVDPDHRPAARAHVAVAFGPALGDVEGRLQERAIKFASSQRVGFPQVLLCRDPSGNRWELRGDLVSESAG